MDDISPAPDAPGAAPPRDATPAPARSALPVWKRPVLVLALFTAAVGGGAVAGALGSGLSPGEAVVGAVSSALSESTAHLHFTETLVSSSGHASVSGSGAIDFASGAAQESVTEPAQGGVVTIHIVYLGGIVYVQVPQLGAIDPGKSWVSIDLSALTKDEQASGLDNLGADPAAALQALEEQGNAVSSLGSSTVDGQAVQGYAVSYDVSAIEHEIAGSSLPSWMRAELKEVSLSHESSTVYVNGSDQLVRLTHAVGLSASGVSGTESGSVDFSDYGAPVSIAGPPSDQVVSFSQFLQSVGGSSPA